MAVLMGWPLIRVVWLSFQQYGLREITRGTTHWVGLDNYRKILGDPYLWTTVLPNTVGFAAGCVAATVVLGTLVALFLHTLPRRVRQVTAAAVLVAWAVPAITGTYVWVFLCDPGDGFVTHVLGGLGLIDTGQINWFLNRTSFFVIAGLNVVHHGFPFVAITVLAGLSTVPTDLYEAAIMDGAGAWRRFWNITVPALSPIFAVVTILSTIWDFKVFTQIYLMPGGGGTNKDVANLGVWSYATSFGQGKYGLGSAIAVLLTLLLLAITTVYLKTVFTQEEL
ncbi:carbohydrate ABC transporter permease [Austwickia sp. TVS 96-490-7B]|uniref:carbohydrate ABC transporter permease n=1 Tax=Austwickia sp. TVS 96-490-7B TaxID=2830843 RepID=UPI001C59E7CB|nr:sugar ABC transporter permease [Austwickia sp. TVS 96-490-7B]